MTGDLDIIKAQLVDRVRELCQRLLPDGREEAGQWVSHNPVTGDRGKTPALKVRLHGGVTGAWKDWRSGDAGDVLKLVAYLEGTDTRGALAWARDFLGLRAMSREERAALRKTAAAKKIEQDRDDSKRREHKLLTADRLYNAPAGERDTGPAYCPAGTFAFGQGSQAERHARAYFAARKVPLDDIAGRYAFRFSPATEWWKGATYKTDAATGRRHKAARGPLYPAVHSAMRIWNGVVTCCHVTFLDPTRPAKAPVAPAKLMFGEALGAVIEVARGPSGKAFWMTEEAAPLIIAEGIETALSFAVVVPEARIWAGGSLAGVAAAPVRLPCVDWILFARDNNAGNSQAQKQFERALESLEASGKRVVVEASHVGDDFNDLARGEE